MKGIDKTLHVNFCTLPLEFYTHTHTHTKLCITWSQNVKVVHCGISHRNVNCTIQKYSCGDLVFTSFIPLICYLIHLFYFSFMTVSVHLLMNLNSYYDTHAFWKISWETISCVECEKCNFEILFIWDCYSWV